MRDKDGRLVYDSMCALPTLRAKCGCEQQAEEPSARILLATSERSAGVIKAQRAGKACRQ